MSLENRIRKLEQALAAAAGERRAYSHAQLVVMARYVLEHGGNPPANWDDVVGPPAEGLKAGELSIANLISCTRLAAPSLPTQPDVVAVRPEE